MTLREDVGDAVDALVGLDIIDDEPSTAAIPVLSEGSTPVAVLREESPGLLLGTSSEAGRGAFALAETRGISMSSLELGL